MERGFLFLLCLFSFQYGTAQNISLQRDPAGRITKVSYPNQKATSYRYDKDGNRLGRVVTSTDTTMLPHSGIITGSSSLCVGSTVTLSETVTGGTWSASNGDITVSSLGVVTGITGGNVIVSYTVTNSYGSSSTIKALTVNPLPNAGTITGSTSVCVGASIALSETVAGGTWSSVYPTAIILPPGVVTGVSGGIDTIKYTVVNSCGAATASHVVTVNPLPSSVTITGAAVVCEGQTIMLVASIPGGSWSSANGNASISGTGVVTGISSGIGIIVYSVTNACGTGSTTYNISIMPTDSCTGSGIHHIMQNDLVKIYPNPTKGKFNVEIPVTNSETIISIFDIVGQKIESRSIAPTSGTTQIFDLKNYARGVYQVEVTFDGKTYEGKVVEW